MNAIQEGLIRTVDITVAAGALIVLAPVLAVVTVAIALDSPGPVIFVQQRVGRNGLFAMFKFRTMAANVGGSHSTAANDPRITAVGRKLRGWSCDELPQLVNVVLGDMSLVGPRPHVPAQRVHYSETQWRNRHGVRPGLTGWAQATLRNRGTRSQHIELDLAYVKQRSFWLYQRILARTAVHLLRQRSF